MQMRNNMKAVYLEVNKVFLNDCTTNHHLLTIVNQNLDKYNNYRGVATLWQPLNFLLTGEFMSQNLMGKAILGEILNTSEDFPVWGVLKYPELVNQVKLLRSVNQELFFYNGWEDDLKANYIFPQRWYSTDKYLKHEMRNALNGLIRFYRNVIQNENGILICIQ
ncbi:MAG: hypothetical protein ATN36_02845 [Epulopiscium sp. Nele67-Bin005]|nr:MAG: hypothetical protein ATN36_02845 [Epulopiscium sp. Nele67-Bin005]